MERTAHGGERCILGRRLGCRGLLNLPDDILLLVCAWLEEKERLPLVSVARFEVNFLVYALIGGVTRQPLRNLSGTCRALRRICIPRIFKLVFLTAAARDQDLPPVLSHVRGFFVGSRGVDRGRLTRLHNLADSLREAYFDGNVQLLPDVLQLPTLEILATCDAEWARVQPPNSLPPIRAPLRCLRICSPDRYNLLADTPQDLSHEIQWVEELCAQLHTRLELVALPAESVRVSLLAKSPWPRLRELFLYGRCPILDVPLLQMLDMMPELRSLTLAVALEQGSGPLILFPRDSEGAPDVSCLRRLTLASPSPEDDLFAHLPPELEELSLRDMPRYYRRCRYPNSGGHLDDAYSPSLLSCTGALSIFRRLRCCAALRHLELVVSEDDNELELLAFLATSCPRLDFFELHCYRNVFEYTELLDAPMAVPLDALSRALSAFRALRVARLNIDLPWTEFTISRYMASGPRDAATFTDTIAHVVAQAVPWLDAVCVLSRHYTGIHEWRMWSVHERAGIVELESLEAIGLDGMQTSDR